MAHTLRSRFVSGVLQFISIMLMVWIVISGPFAVISALSDLTDWKSVLLAPADSWGRHLPALLENLPVASSLPQWAVNLLYIIFLVACGAWYYWTAVLVEAKRQFDAATSGTLGSIHAPEPKEESLGEGVAAGVGAGILGGGLGAATTLGIVTGPPGWAILAGVAAIAAYLGWTARRKRNEADDVEHAEAETKRIEKERYTLAQDNVSRFKKRETRKLLVAWSIVAFIVAANFVGPMIFSHLG